MKVETDSMMKSSVTYEIRFVCLLLSQIHGKHPKEDDRG